MRLIRVAKVMKILYYSSRNIVAYTERNCRLNFVFNLDSRSRMSQEALEIFDICNTVIISFALLLTLPVAAFVYSKLLFTLPYSRNYTFKLIVFNGITVKLIFFRCRTDAVSGVAFLH